MRPDGRPSGPSSIPPLGSQLRAVTIDGAPWFLAKDVCDALGLAGTTNIRRDLYEDEVRDFKPVSGAGFRGRPPLVVNESGLYRIIMKSEKGTARPFQDWVTREVLPALRKDGSCAPVRRTDP